MNLIDTHAHLDGPEFDEDRAAVLARAREAGVGRFIQIGYSAETIMRGMRLFAQDEQVFFTAGIHPHEAGEFSPELMKLVEQALDHPRAVAVGEVGLDYFRDYGPADSQQQVFREMIRLAKSRDLPLVIHSRAAEEDTLRLLAEEEANYGVMHCYAYDAQVAARLMQMGFVFSFPCSVTYKKRNQREVLEALPLSHILLETDSPFLPPQRIRGKRNEPANVVDVAQVIAEVKGVSLEEVASATTANAERVFRLPGERKPVYAYPLGDSLYLNLTNRCTAHCVFCAHRTRPVIGEYHLGLARSQEPGLEDLEQAWRSYGPLSRWQEVVFCGYGEPTIRWELLLAAARRLKEEGVRIRINTNGHAELYHKRPLAAELAGLVDEVSVSLNAPTASEYARLVKTPWGEAAWQGLQDFAANCLRAGVPVVYSVVDDGSIDVAACRALAEAAGVEYRVRVSGVGGKTSAPLGG